MDGGKKRGVQVVTVENFAQIGEPEGGVVSAVATSDFSELLRSVREKWSYRDVQALLKQHGLGGSLGWEQLLERLNSAAADQAATAQRVLRGLQADLVLAGTKDVHVFLLESVRAQRLAEEARSLQPDPAGTYASTYPLPLSESALREVSGEHELVSVVRHEAGDVSLVFCAKRTEEERLHYDYGDVTQAVQQAFVGFDEFIAVRRTDYQVFDVLTVRPKLQRLEVLVDHPGKIRAPETSESRCLRVLGRAMVSLQDLCSIYESNTPLNLFPCISGMYHSSREGRVARLSFRSPTDSIKKEHMTSSKDLRVEAFHDAGVKAVGDITPYEITLIWDNMSSNVAAGTGLRIGMPIAGLSSESPYVRQAQILNAPSDTAVVALVNKLVSYSS